MNKYKEIVTKAVIGKGKKNFVNKYNIKIDEDVNTVLGCWVINHFMNGTNRNGLVDINGGFDVNIWYSTENNSKTNVIKEHVDYNELVKVNVKENGDFDNSSDIIIRSLKNPSCIDVEVDDKNQVINYTIEKELGIEIVGDAKIKVLSEDNYDDYEIIEDEEITEEELKNIDNEINEDYIIEK